MTITEMLPAPFFLALVGMPGRWKTLCAHHLERRGFFPLARWIVVDEVRFGVVWSSTLKKMSVSSARSLQQRRHG